MADPDLHNLEGMYQLLNDFNPDRYLEQEFLTLSFFCFALEILNAEMSVPMTGHAQIQNCNGNMNNSIQTFAQIHAVPQHYNTGDIGISFLFSFLGRMGMG